MAEARQPYFRRRRAGPVVPTCLYQLREALADPSDRSADQWAFVPAASDDSATQYAEPVTCHHERSGLGLVLDLPRPLADRMRASNAESYLGVIAEVDQPGRVLNSAATPALGRVDLGMVIRRAVLAHWVSPCMPAPSRRSLTAGFHWLVRSSRRFRQETEPATHSRHARSTWRREIGRPASRHPRERRSSPRTRCRT